MGALAALGIDAEERGDEAVAMCPHPDHHDRRPSWSCNLDSGEHHCFACGFGGSFQFLVGKMLGLTRGDTSRWITDRMIGDVAEGFVRTPVVRQAAPVSEADMWSFTDPPADALASRGLTLEACQQYGVKWDNARELWITPVRDPTNGKLWGWQEKNARLFNNHPRDLAKSKALFGYSLVPMGGTVLLVESPLDVPYLRSHLLRAGIDEVYPVSSYGATVSDAQVRLLNRRAGRLILALDNDRAGWKSVAQLAHAFDATVSVVIFNYGNVEATPTADVVGEPDDRDPGNLSMDDVAWGIEEAIANWRLSIPWL